MFLPFHVSLSVSFCLSGNFFKQKRIIPASRRHCELAADSWVGDEDVLLYMIFSYCNRRTYND